MGQSVSVSSSCAQIGGPWPMSIGHCPTIPLDLQHRFKHIARDLLSSDVTEVVVRVAERGPPNATAYSYPHDTTKDDFAYNYNAPSWWASGFFPGSLWLLYERSLKTPQSVSSDHLLALARQWQQGMEAQQYNTGTHDLGFMILPSFDADYRLTGSPSARDVVATAAHSLSTRWSETVGCIRSWNSMSNAAHDWTDSATNYLVIIDNMMNLPLLYRGAELTNTTEFARIATTHAKTTLKHHIRPDSSTYHLVDYSPTNGSVIGRYTFQGYADNSTWTRGQAWGVYGYTSAYKYTRDPAFLSAAKRLAGYFIKRMEMTSRGTGMVYWDFDAPETSPPIRDSSAAMVVCSGLLELYSLTKDPQYLPAVAQILEYAVKCSKAPRGADTILRGATVNNAPLAKTKDFETGLVYADYYFLEVGNRLMELGLA